MSNGVQISGALVSGDVLVVTLLQGSRQFQVEFTGEITTSFNSHPSGASVSFTCKTRSEELPVKRLNRPPLNV